jgi:hypothetical protein
MARRFKTFGIIFLLIFCRIIPAGGQSFHFSDSLGPILSSSYNKIIGTLDDRPLVLHGESSKQFLELLTFDSTCTLLSRKPLPFIPIQGLIKTDLFANTLSWDIMWQHMERKIYYTSFARINRSGDPLYPRLLVDSFEMPENLRNGFPMNVISSPNQRYYLTYIALYDSASGHAIYLVHRVDADSVSTSASSLRFAFNPGLDKVSKPYLDNEGNVFLAKYDDPNNYRLGSTLTVYRQDKTGNVESVGEMYLKENKPLDIAFFENENVLYLGSLYNDFYTRKCRGIACYALHLKEGTWDSVSYLPFPSDMFKQLHRYIFAIPPKDLMSYLEIEQFYAGKEEGFMFLFNLEYSQYRNRDINGQSPFSRQNRQNSNDLRRYSDMPQNAAVSGGGGRGRRSARSFGTNIADGTLNSGGGGLPGNNPLNLSNDPFSLKPNPTVHKSMMLELHPAVKDPAYAIQYSITNPEYHISAPLASILNRSMLHFRYEVNSKGGLVLHKTETGPGIPVKDAVLSVNDPRHLFLRDNSWLEPSGRYLLAFYEDELAHRFGLARLSW